MADDSTNDPKLSFYIVHCSGEDESFPVRELAKRTSQTRGWQTPKMCEYPQEIVFRFEGEVELSALRIMSHESKIASRIYIYIAGPTDENRRSGTFGDPPLDDSQFQRLGFMGFTTNEVSNFNARELKTVHMRHRACYLKLSIKKHHPNQLNPFNQVGIIGVSFHGQLLQRYQPPPPLRLTAQQASDAQSGNAHELPVVQQEIEVTANDEGDLPLSALVPGMQNPAPTGSGPVASAAAANAEDEADSTGFDPTTRRMIKELTLHKARAVEEEDYDLAKVLKQRIQDLTELGTELAQLEASKKEAVMSEDYDTAKMLKLKIDGLRARAANPQAVQQPPPPPPPAQVYHQPAYSQQGRQEQHHHADSSNADAGHGSAPPPEPHHQHHEAEQDQAPKRQPAQRAQAGNFDERPAMAQNPKTLDELIEQGETGGIVVASKPAPKGKSAPPMEPTSLPTWENKMSTLVTQIAGGDPAETLVGQKLAEYKDYVNAFGGYVTACLFSKRWQLRDGALKAIVSPEGFGTLTSGNRSGGNPTNVVGTLLQYLNAKGYGLQDAIGNVFFTSADVLRKVVCEEISPDVPLSSVTATVTLLLPELLLKAGDNNPRMREQSSAVLMMIGANHAVGYAPVSAAALNEPESGGAGKKPLSHRVPLARIHIVTSILEKAGLNRKESRSGLTSEGIMTKLVIPNLSHASNEVREAAMNLVVTLHQYTTPSALASYISEMKPQQQQYIQEKLEDGGAEAGSGGGGAAAAPARSGPSPKKSRPPPKDDDKEMMSSSQSVDKNAGKVHPMLQAARDAKGGGGGGGGPAPPAKGAGKKKTPPAGGKASAPKPAAVSKEDEAKTCQFCGKYDARFTEHTMDIHYVRTCPMLCPCPLCGEVTEISTLQEHLVKECKRKNMVRKCPICHEAVRAEDLDPHVAANDCIPANPAEYSVCPLCHMKLSPGDEGWEQHLLKAPGCQNNPRRFDGGDEFD
jgi:centrosomal protein CEP104